MGFNPHSTVDDDALQESAKVFYKGKERKEEEPPLIGNHMKLMYCEMVRDKTYLFLHYETRTPPTPPNKLLFSVCLDRD